MTRYPRVKLTITWTEPLARRPEPSNPGLRCNFVLLASAQPCIEELLVQAQSLRGPSRQRSDDECASHPLNTPTRALPCAKSGVSIARSVRSVHRRRGASVTVSRAPRTARARPARLRHSCWLLRARQPSGRSRSTPTLLTASTERPHPLLPSGKHRAWCRRLASEYAVPVRQINLLLCKTQSTKRKTSSFC